MNQSTAVTSGTGELLRQLVTNSSALAGALVLQRAVSLLMMPLYLSFITPDEFGMVALVLTVSAATAAVLGFGLETAIFRTYFALAQEPTEQTDYLKTAGLFLIAVPNLLTGALVTVLLTFFDRIAGVPAYYFGLGLAASTLYVSATALPFAVLRARQRLRSYMLLNCVYLVVQTTAMIAGIIWLDAGAAGWLAASLFSSGALLLAGVCLVPVLRTGRVHWRHLRPSLGYGLPLVPHYLAHWVLSLSDRAILAASVSLTSLGIYNFGYQVGAVMGMVFVSLQLAVQPHYVRAASGRVDDRMDLAAVVSLQAAAVVALSVCFALLAPPAIEVLFPASYAAAGGLLPWFALGYGFFGLYFIPMNVLSLTLGETKWVWLATAVAATTNAAINLALVPRFGIELAAVSTAAGYGTLLVAMTAYVVLRGYRLTLPWPVLGGLVVVLGAIYVAGRLSGPDGDWGAILWRSLLIAGASAAAYAARGLIVLRTTGPQGLTAQAEAAARDVATGRETLEGAKG